MYILIIATLPAMDERRVVYPICNLLIRIITKASAARRVASNHHSSSQAVTILHDTGINNFSKVNIDQV